jgi:hypothetical protein
MSERMSDDVFERHVQMWWDSDDQEAVTTEARRARASEAAQAEELKRLRDLLRLARGLGKLGADWVQSRHMGDMSHAKEFKAEWGRIQELIDAALASEAGSVRRKE